jgi:hypothetical protein
MIRHTIPPDPSLERRLGRGARARRGLQARARCLQGITLP